MSALFRCSVRGPLADPGDRDRGRIDVEQLDPDGEEWYATGPRGEHMGAIADVLQAVAESGTDPAWLEVVAEVIAVDRVGDRRIGLVARRGRGRYFHTTFADNRASIRAHGLDWRRFNGSGIAGSQAPEADGIFLSADAWSAEWFGQMGRRRERGEVDIWEVQLEGQWLVSDPGSSGGLDDDWVICLEPIPAAALRLRAVQTPDAY